MYHLTCQFDTPTSLWWALRVYIMDVPWEKDSIIMAYNTISTINTVVDFPLVKIKNWRLKL